MYNFYLAVLNSLKGIGSEHLLTSPLPSLRPLLVVSTKMKLFESVLPHLANKPTGTRQLSPFLQNLSDFF